MRLLFGIPSARVRNKRDGVFLWATMYQICDDYKKPAPGGCVYIYRLLDPRSCETKYIGITNQPLLARLKAHIREGENGTGNLKAEWVRELLADGVFPIIELVEVAPIYGVMHTELFWIYMLKARGFALVNGEPVVDYSYLFGYRIEFGRDWATFPIERYLVMPQPYS